MNNSLPNINSQDEVKKIKSFIKKTMLKQQKQNVVIGVSGGIDSAVCLHLLKDIIPLENINVTHLPYFDNYLSDISEITSSIHLPKRQITVISIKPIVDVVSKTLGVSDKDIVRKGNIMARIRMVILYDFAKKINALVCGTENKSEHLLGYFTRNGDEASDLEPIRHLYKTQVYELAKFLNVPKSVIDKQPSANLWQGQTDEDELGFSYKEADNVLYLHFDKKMSAEEVESKGFRNAKKIIDFAQKNSYKHKVPYTL